MFAAVRTVYGAVFAAVLLVLAVGVGVPVRSRTAAA